MIKGTFIWKKILNYIKESGNNAVILKHKTLPLTLTNDDSPILIEENKPFEIYIRQDFNISSLINISAWVQTEHLEAERILRTLCDEIDEPMIDGGCDNGSVYEYLVNENDLHLFSRFYSKLNFEEWDISFEKDE